MNNKTTEISTTKTTPQAKYKDTVFRMLFSDKKELLTLYNAVNNTSYDNPDELSVTTLENAIYMTVKNDLSCVVDMRLNLYEHQSTVNPNLPLRDLRLSDAFIHKEEHPSLELVVTQININPGYNDDFLIKCPTLKQYMQYVDRVRTYQKNMPLENAVAYAVDECIKEGILTDFLRKNKAEVISMSVYEYDEKLHEKTLIELGREEGHREGRKEGILGSIAILKDMGCSEEQIVSKLVEIYHLSGKEALSFLKNNI